MEENEGKDLALEEKIKAQFEYNVRNLIQKYEEGNMTAYEIGNVRVDITKANKSYMISFGGYNLCTVDSDNKVIYDLNELEKFKEKSKELMEAGMPDLAEELGLPDIEYLKYLEKEKNKKFEEEKNKSDKEKEDTEEEKDKEKDDDDEKDKDKDEDEKDNDNEKLDNSERGLQELNLGVLRLINPRLRECKKAYLDIYTNTLKFRDKQGVLHEPEDYGFSEKRAYTANPQLSEMGEEGVTHKNPTRIYDIRGSVYGVSIDYLTHAREVDITTREKGSASVDSYSKAGMQLLKYDSGYISTYRAKDTLGTREGPWQAGERDKVNEKAKEFLATLSDDEEKEFKEGLNAKPINDNGDLKLAIATVLQEEYNETPENAKEIAERIVDNNEEYEKVKRDIGNPGDTENDGGRAPGGFGPWDNPRDRR